MNVRNFVRGSCSLARDVYRSIVTAARDLPRALHNLRRSRADGLSHRGIVRGLGLGEVVAGEAPRIGRHAYAMIRRQQKMQLEGEFGGREETRSHPSRRCSDLCQTWYRVLVCA